MSVFGGSHAGFINCQLIEDPEMASVVRVAVIRNPIVYLPLVYTAGVPKWAFNSFLGFTSSTDRPVAR